MRHSGLPAGLSESRAGLRYTARWHRVEAWAREVLPGDVESRPARNPRVAIIRGQWVIDLGDEEEAEHHARDLAVMEIELGPRGAARNGGGRRRVIIRVFSWVVDVRAGVLHDAQWMTTGEGLTARSAAAAHNRYVRAYAQAVIAGVESRRLAVTAMEVVFWTAAAAARYV